MQTLAVVFDAFPGQVNLSLCFADLNKWRGDHSIVASAALAMAKCRVETAAIFKVVQVGICDDRLLSIHIVCN